MLHFSLVCHLGFSVQEKKPTIANIMFILSLFSKTVTSALISSLTWNKNHSPFHKNKRANISLSYHKFYLFMIGCIRLRNFQIIRLRDKSYFHSSILPSYRAIKNNVGFVELHWAQAILATRRRQIIGFFLFTFAP